MFALQKSLIFLFIWNKFVGLAISQFWNIIKIWICEKKKQKKKKT
jgi:hypothetical protein